MAQYKVPQNVESEDKILGPLSLKQFIYVIIALMWGFLMWRIFIHTPIIAVILALPVSGVFLALGLIQREEQSFENYFIAMVRFIIVPRKRVWHKDDIREVFARPEPPRPPTPSFAARNPEQVKGQLEKLALIVDTRGQAAKSSDIQLPDASNQAAQIAARVNVAATPSASQTAPAQVTVNDDILDMQNNAAAVTVGHLLENVETHIRDQAKNAMKNPQNLPKAQATSQAPPSGAILDMAAAGGNLSVAQIAKKANRNPQTLSENQTVQLR